MLGSHLVKSWCRRQKVKALSSAEAETYAPVCASCEGLGIAAYGRDSGVAYDIEAYTDAKAALRIIQRTGVGKVIHIRTQALWLHELGREKRIQYHKQILGDSNPADATTKHLAESKMNEHVAKTNTRFEGGHRWHQHSARWAGSTTWTRRVACLQSRG